MFCEHPFPARFEAARRAGFFAVEMQYPYDLPARRIAEALTGAGVDLVLFNTPPGDRAQGGPGCAALPGREAAFREGFRRALDYAWSLRPRFLHVLGGVPPAGTSRARIEDVLAANLEWATAEARGADVELLLEALNPQDVPGYAFGRQTEVADFLRRTKLTGVRLQFDTWHTARAGEDVLAIAQKVADVLGHVQVGAPPDRREPQDGPVDFAGFFEWLRRSGYDGWIGCEYVPQGRTEDGLGWVWRYGLGPALRDRAQTNEGKTR